MDIIHTRITFKDTFSGSLNIKTTTLSKQTFDKIKANDIGKIVPYFDKVQQIRYNYEVIKIEQTK